MNLKSILMSIIVFGFATFLSLLVSPAASKGDGYGTRRPMIRPGIPAYKSSLDVSSKTFGPEKVVAFAAGAYVGGKVANKVN